MLRTSSNMLMQLMRNLLDASKIDANMMKTENIDFDLSKLVQDAVHIISTKVEEKGLDFHLHISTKLSTQCIGDPLRISQILLNLLSNSVKFTQKGHVALFVDMKLDVHGNNQLSITVSDTGIGISKDSIVKIFDKYTQANASITRQYGGTGLGLSISQDLAHLMQGNITVKSQLGKGSHFTLTLPLATKIIILPTTRHF